MNNFKMPAGRIVEGNPCIMQDRTNFLTKEKELDSNGNVVQENRVSIAYPKDVFMSEVYPVLNQEISKVYPHYANMHPDNYETCKFSTKIINGDSPNVPQNSKTPYNTRDGFPGCYIVKFNTRAFLPGMFKWNTATGTYVKIEPNEVKCGDYVVVNTNIVVHTMKDGGIYWNPNAYEFVGYGKEIKTSSSNPVELFGNTAPQLPAGASATPVSSAPVNATMPTPALMTTQAPQAAMPAPAYDFLQNAGVPSATGFMQPVASAAAPQQSVQQVENGTANFATTFPTR